MIDLIDITKNYIVDGKQFQGLKGITVTIAKGEFVSIMGPSGSGKSTLSSILGCLASPSSGTYKIAGRVVTDLKTTELADLRNSLIGFVFQDFNLLDGVTVLENVSLPLIYARVSPSERRKRALQKLEQMGLAHKAKTFPNQLSGGQKQRVAIARALVTDPKLIFADEPTGALDKKTGNDIMGILQDLNREGQTVVQVTHSAEHGNYGKRIIYIVDGLIVRDELVARPTLAKGIELESNSVETELTTKLWRIAAFTPKNEEASVAAMEYLISQKNNTLSFMEAAKALVKKENPRIKNLIVRLLDSPEAIVRAETLRQLEQCNHEFAIPHWWKGVQDENGWVRFVACTQLRKHLKTWLIEDKNVFAALSIDSDERVRATVVSQLGEWNDLTFEGVLVKAYSDTDPRVRANSLDALRFLGEKISLESRNCFKQGLQDPNNRARANAVVGYSLFDLEKSKETLFQMLEDKNNLMRASAAWVVGKILLYDGAEILMKNLVSEKNELVTSQIIATLGLFTHHDLTFQTQIETCLRIKGELLPKQTQAKAA
ncbi:MAG: ATP-binding cassette domain-containing protein [Deltaproteobacteria bacterium]|nr:ATP-binding cassette domain-containing protein [Deltaproteobacteria bacterium]